MHGIFINYRREDVTGFARSVFDRLRSHFGESQVFMDVSNIEPGLDFIETINKGLRNCEALLVLIGPDWESICVARSGETNDYVRIEVAAALKRNVRVIPILVQGATMPVEDNLPEDIKPLVRRQATALSNDRFDSDIARLIEVLEKTLGSNFKPTPKSDPIKKNWLSGRSGVLVGFVAAFVLLVFIGVWVEGDEFEPADNLEFKRVSPITPVDVDGSWSVSQIMEIQQLLQRLGYQPGIADGVMGENTITVIKEFQRDQGQTASGRINNQLLNALVAAKPLNQTVSTVLDLRGTWYDNFGNRVLITQQGNQVRAVMNDPYSGQKIYDSSGTVYGNQLNYQWQTNESSGTGVGTMQTDMRHMDFFITDNSTGMVDTDRLHKEHMPGQ